MSPIMFGFGPSGGICQSCVKLNSNMVVLVSQQTPCPPTYPPAQEANTFPGMLRPQAE